MKQLVYSARREDGRVERHWRHYGDDGKEKLTVEVIEDAEPILDQNKSDYADAPARFGSGTFYRVASIPVTEISNLAQRAAISWEISTREAFSELTINKTDRAKAAWRSLLNARDLRDFRCRPGRV